MKKKHLLSALLLAMLALVSCNDAETDETEADTSKESGTADTTIVTESGVVLPVENYDGYNFRIIARGMGKWACEDMFSEGYTGEGINDAVFTRNAYIQDTLGVTISEEQYDNDSNLANTIRRSVRAGDDAYDLLWVDSYNITNLALEGMLNNLYSIDTLNLGHEWWDPRAVENLTIGNSVFFTTGDISIISKYATYVMTFNKTLAEEYHLEDFYELVRNKKWTVDKFGELAAQVTNDENGDGVYGPEDLYGFMTYGSDNMGFLLSAGGSIAKMNGDTITTNYNTEPVIDMLTRLAAIKNSPSTFQFSGDQEADAIFVDGRTLFSFRTLINLKAYRDMETDYGILPTPMLNEQQDGYNCGVHKHGLSLIATPITSENFSRTGLILEHMGQKSKEELTPAFYDKTLKGKYFSDEESGEMLDIIFASRVYDIGYFCDWGGISGVLDSLSLKKADTFSSSFASIEKKVTAAMEDTVKVFGDVEVKAADILQKAEELKTNYITEEDLLKNDYVVGTLAAASGELDTSNKTRLSLESYLPMAQFGTVTVGADYELTWLAYDANKAYLGNGNPEKKGNWLGAGVAITADAITAVHPEAAYVRFAMRKTDNSELTTAKDVEASGLTIVLANNSYRVGTIAAATGQYGDNKTRVMIDDYLPLRGVKKITINSGYELTWLAYDGNQAYIGNGNPEYKGVWLPAGESIETSVILENYSEASYVRYALRKVDGSEMTLEDVALSQVSIISTGTIVDIETTNAETTEEPAEESKAEEGAFPGYKVGTLSAATGEFGENATRVMTEEYISLDALKEVTIDGAYELTWLAYGADKTYIGNGNPEKKGNWIGAGKPFTAEEILANYADAAYVRFAFRKTDNSNMTLDDVAASKVTLVAKDGKSFDTAAAPAYSFKVGTLAAATGEFGENATRVMIEDYLPLASLKEVTIDGAYELTWLAYGADKTYIGNGNPEKKGNWIGAGKPFTAEEILANYADAAYVRFAFRKTDNSNMTLDDVTTSNVTITAKEGADMTTTAETKAPATYNFRVGTIAAATGAYGENNTRLMLDDYLDIDLFEEVTIGSNYELTWLAYDANKTYIGNGNPEKKGNWIGAGNHFTAEGIRTTYPDADYIRFALRKIDNAVLTLADVEKSNVTIVPSNTYKVGTLNAADGTANETNKTRLYMENYLELAAIKEVTIGSDYELTWLAYDANKAYIGNGNPEKKGNWIGAGNPFASQTILDSYPDAIYFRFALRKADNSELTANDIAASGVKVVRAKNLVVYDYTGKSLGTTMQMSYESQNWSVVSGQDGAMYGDWLFRFDGTGGCTVYSISGKKQVSTFKLPKTDLLSPHSNAVCFGAERVEDSDEFPLLYTNLYNNYSGAEDKKEGVCLVYRLMRNDTTFTAELVQVIEIGFVDNLDYWKSTESGDVRPYGNFVVDAEGKQLYAFTMRDKEKVTRYFGFDLPTLADGTMNDTYGCHVVTLNVEDIKTQFDSEYSNFIQGACFHDGMIYSVEGFSNAAPNLPRMQIIDPVAKEQYAAIDLCGIGLIIEPEMVEFHDGTLYYIDAHGQVRTFLFY